MAKLRGGAGTSENFHSSIIHQSELEGFKPDENQPEESAKEFNLPQHEKISSQVEYEINGIEAQIAQLQNELNHKKELRSAMRDIPVLFDTDNFEELNDHLNLLEEAGIKKIKIGEKTDSELSPKDIRTIIKFVVKEYGDPKAQEAISTGSLSEETINNLLRSKGITSSKISSRSSEGFRGCLIKCIKTMSRNSVDQTEVVSTESAGESDTEKEADIRRKIREI